MKKSWFKNWEIDRIIDFGKVDIVKERTAQHFTGKASVTFHWLVFVMKDGRKEELFINGYDYGGLKSLFFHFKNKLPEVKFDNSILRDSSEVIAGLLKK